MIDLALYEPEIPHNTGALMRLCACMNVPLHLIEPLGFVLSDKHLKRASMDYIDLAVVQRHANFDQFRESQKKKDRRIVLLDTKGSSPLYAFTFREDDILLMGTESSGVPEDVFDVCDEIVYIPMDKNCRSLNLAIAAAMTLGEALRQCRYE